MPFLLGAVTEYLRLCCMLLFHEWISSQTTMAEKSTSQASTIANMSERKDDESPLLDTYRKLGRAECWDTVSPITWTQDLSSRHKAISAYAGEPRIPRGSANMPLLRRRRKGDLSNGFTIASHECYSLTLMGLQHTTIGTAEFHRADAILRLLSSTREMLRLSDTNSPIPRVLLESSSNR